MINISIPVREWFSGRVAASASRAEERSGQSGQAPKLPVSATAAALARIEIPPNKEAVREALETSRRRLMVFGGSVVAVFFGGFFAWSWFAPIEAAVVATGQIVVASDRDTIQAENGGVISAILHHDGDHVARGDVLVRFDDTKAKAAYQLLLVRAYEQTALRARLVAERDGLDAIEFPPDLLSSQSNPQIEAAVKGQRNVFQARRETLNNQIGVLNQSIAEYKQQISGIKDQITAQDAQLDLLAQDEHDASGLLDKGLISKTRVLTLRGQIASMQGARAQNKTNIARVEQQISAAQLEIAGLANKQMDDVLGQLRDVDTQLSDLQEKLRSADHDLQAMVVRAPAAGVVFGSNVHTVGGVVAPGAVVMELVPDGEQLIVEAQIRPQDIENVHQGLQASVRLTGFNRRVTPSVDGKVIYVSADSLTDKASQTKYYVAKVQLDLKAKPDTANLALVPGMPAQVMVITGSRTLMQYIFSPITAGISQALHEEY